ncbi:hypothetical protein G9A89_013810 [Geosiphon pyriformis]|nr:hypothetical protein G9A89_013810 [Geosiphon pyriformis]
MRLRLLVYITLYGLIIVASIPNFKKLFKNQEPLISISLLNDKSKSGIPVPDASICIKQNVTNYVEKITIEYQMVDNNNNNNNNINTDYIFINGTSSNSTRVKLEPLEGLDNSNCLRFERLNDPRLIYYPVGIESIRIKFWRNLTQLIARQTLNSQIFNSKNSKIGFLFVTYVGLDNDQEENIYDLKGGSLNEYTFKVIERVDVEGYSHWYTESEKIKEYLTDDALILEIWFYPTDFLVTKYTENKAYSLINFISSFGGFLTFTSTIWLVLFGPGKFKSWGIIQKYLLKSSPDAKKNRMKLESKYGDISHNPSSTSSLQNDTFVDIPYFQINRLPSHSPLSKLNNNSMFAVDADEIKNLKRKINWLSQLLSQEYLEDFDLETYSALNEPTINRDYM